MVVPAARSDTMVIPGATTSGLATPSGVGPSLEKAAILSSFLSIVFLRSAAPTVRTKGSSPGLLIVLWFESGARFPAATTTRMPDAHTRSTA